MNRQRIRIKRGLNLPILGAPSDEIEDGAPVQSVALLGPDYHGLKPRMHVAVGDRVKLGQDVFSDKSRPGVVFTAPGTGTVRAINRGQRRILQSVVIDLEGDDEVEFQRHAAETLGQIGTEAVVQQLLDSGLWTALRSRPFSRVPDPETRPEAIFVTAMNTDPLARHPDGQLTENAADFNAGLTILGQLTEGSIYLCCAPGQELPELTQQQVRIVEFEGPHPAGVVGTHIHFLRPASHDHTVWHIAGQEVIAVGKLFTTGRLWTERVISLSGPRVVRPRLLRTRLGASISDLVRGEIKPGTSRILGGSVFNGHRASGWGAYLGRYDRQITALGEGSPRQFMHWLRPGLKRFSAVNAFLSTLVPGARFEMTTCQNGSPRAMVPIGNFEKVMPLDVLPAPLLKSLIVKDTDTAQALGCLELDEEDLALCAFVCPSKYDYGAFLRENLTIIEKEG